MEDLVQSFMFGSFVFAFLALLIIKLIDTVSVPIDVINQNLNQVSDENIKCYIFSPGDF